MFDNKNTIFLFGTAVKLFIKNIWYMFWIS